MAFNISIFVSFIILASQISQTMKWYLITLGIASALLCQNVTAQQDTLKKGSVYFKSIRIIGNDTIVDEKSYDLDQPGLGQKFSFRFGDDEDTLDGDNPTGFFFHGPEDSVHWELNELPFRNGEQLFDTDSLFRNFQFKIPGWEQQEPFRFDFRELNPGQFLTPEGLYPVVPGMQRFPVFSVEDVAIYPESNSVKNFVIRPVQAAGILITEADLNNKRSTYTVYDSKGKVLVQEKFKNIDGKFRRILDLQELKSGTYFVEIKNGRSVKKKRLTIR